VFGHKLFMPYYVTAGRRCPAFLPMLRSDLAVHLHRRDKVAQAVSLARAQQTQAWASWIHERAAPIYDPGLIGRCLEKLLDHERWWAAAFELTGAAVLSVAYEDCVGREDEVLADVRRRLGLPASSDCPPVRIDDLARQGDTISAEWVARFKAEEADRTALAQGRASADDPMHVGPALASN
jgi:LPS sulfotransferase NodH